MSVRSCRQYLDRGKRDSPHDRSADRVGNQTAQSAAVFTEPVVPDVMESASYLFSSDWKTKELPSRRPIEGHSAFRIGALRFGAFIKWDSPRATANSAWFATTALIVDLALAFQI